VIRRFSTNFAVFSIFVDLLVITGTLWFTNLFRPALSALPILRLIKEPKDVPWEVYLIFPVVWVIILFSVSVYDGQKTMRVVDEYAAITLGSIYAGITMAGVLYLTYRDISRGYFVFFVIFAYLILIIWRAIARIFYRRRLIEKDYFRRILVVGAGPVGLDFQKRLDQFYKGNHKFLGFLDDSPQKQQNLKEVLGPVDDIATRVKELEIDDVVITLPHRAYDRISFIVKELTTLPVKIWVVPDFFHLVLHRAIASEFAGLPMLDLRAPALTEYQRLIKRVFDVFVTTIILIPGLPLIGLISLFIWIFDGRPILFKQERVGENGRLFTMFKFRTMVRDAEKLKEQAAIVTEDGQVIHKHRNDPRITFLGRILRRFSLDELPQFFNVMRGTMSLVGPRPELLELVEKYDTWQRTRFAVPQGLTGWWQVNGRSDRPMHLNTEDDLYYVQHYSIWLDYFILIKSVWIVLRGKGAY
jgi:exopolysaccharide biosynthesis polyprenyl glycosylphosphotransferase